MAEIVFGADVMAENCVIMGNVNTNSPLLVDKVVTESARVYSTRGQGMVVVPFILSGAMGPVSTAASVAQAMAEAMMVCAYVQLLRPGAPFVLGNFLSSMSLKSGAPTFGMPEPVMSNYAIGQLARRAGLPLRCGGSLTASKIEDAQAAYESADSMHSTMLAGANYVLHSAGWLEGGLCAGYEKLIMDADRLGSYQKVLDVGLDTSDEAFARDAYGEVEAGGHFLGCSHTMRNYQTAFYEPKTKRQRECRKLGRDRFKRHAPACFRTLEPDAEGLPGPTNRCCNERCAYRFRCEAKGGAARRLVLAPSHNWSPDFS